MDPWVSRSRPFAQLSAAAGSAAVGVFLMIVTQRLPDGDENATAGFLLGVLLSGIGVAAASFSGAQTVTVDPRTRRIRVLDSSLIGRRERVVAFAEVRDVGIGYVGKASSYVGTYYLVLHLADGAEYALFAPGRFYRGASDRSVVEGWRSRLVACLEAADASVQQRNPADGGA